MITERAKIIRELDAKYNSACAKKVGEAWDGGKISAFKKLRDMCQPEMPEEVKIWAEKQDEPALAKACWLMMTDWFKEKLAEAVKMKDNG